jgi:hypothetical protein
MNHLNCKTMKTNQNNSKASKETKQVQVKFFKEASIFDQIDVESLALFREMMADRYGSLNEEEE